jgi:hypothetical protein
MGIFLIYLIYVVFKYFFQTSQKTPRLHYTGQLINIDMFKIITAVFSEYRTKWSGQDAELFGINTSTWKCTAVMDRIS